MHQWSKMLIVDLESTCFEKGDADMPEGWTAEKDQEITEIGAVIYNLPRREVEAVRSFLVYPEGPMGKFCQKLTSLTLEDVRFSPDLEGTLKKELKLWCKEHKFALDQQPWGSWGDYDRIQLFRECARKNIKYPFGRAHYNIKGLFSMHQYRVKGFGIGAALDILGTEFEGRPHRGVDAALMVAKILSRILG